MVRTTLMSLAFVSAPLMLKFISGRSRRRGRRSSTRCAIVCATLVREIGALRSFSIAGRYFAPEEFEACNRRALAN